MKKILLLLLLIAMLISGCGGSQDKIRCIDYCMQQPHAECIGQWQASGTYPDCTCNFICTEENIVEVQPDEIQEPVCTNECDAGACVGSKYYDCVLKPDGCMDKVEWKVRKGTCGVDCMSNSDCSGQECTAYKCKAAIGSMSLKNLPKPFSDDAILVVGANAPASDVAAAGAVSAMLVYEGGKKFDTKLDSQITAADYAHNLIILGNPCDNNLIEKVFGIVCDGLDLNENQAILKLADSKGKAALLISGKTPSATMGAANKVAKYDTSGLSGSEMVINV